MTSEEDKKPKKGHFVCEIPTYNLSRGCSTSKDFSIDGVSQFTIKTRYTENDNNVTIIISKTNTEVIYADISLIVKQNHCCLMKRAEECIVWVETYPFFLKTSEPRNWNWRLEITCDITLHDSSESINPSFLEDLHNYVKSSLLSSKLSDFTIIIGKEELPVHKFVLASQSSVFLSIFESAMQEPKTDRLIIEDISTKTMKRVLAYLYTRSLDALKNPKILLEVLIAAEKYNIMKLKDLCECKMTEQITVWNALELFEEADVHKLKNLRGACFNFIVENKQQIINQSSFKILCFKKLQLLYPIIMKWLNFQQQ